MSSKLPQPPQSNISKPQQLPKVSHTKEQEINKKAYYVPQGIPAELPGDRSGSVVGAFSIICGLISFVFYPVIFGPIGIVLGVMSKKRGSRRLGITGIILSSVFMTIGMLLGFLFYEEAGASGLLLFGLF